MNNGTNDLRRLSKGQSYVIKSKQVNEQILSAKRREVDSDSLLQHKSFTGQKHYNRHKGFSASNVLYPLG